MHMPCGKSDLTKSVFVVHMRIWNAWILLSAFAFLTSSIVTVACAQESNASTEVEQPLDELEMRLDETNAALRRFSPDALKMAQETEEFALALPESPRRTEGIARSVRYQVSALLTANEPEKALEQLTRLKQYAVSANPKELGDIYLYEGQANRLLGHYGKAIENFQSAFDAYSRANAPVRQGMALRAVSATYFYAHQYERALEYNRRAGEIEAEDESLTMSILIADTILLGEVNRVDEAITVGEQALAFARDHERHSSEQLILSGMANVEMKRENYLRAEQYVSKALELNQAHGVDLYVPTALSVKAEIELRRGNLLGAQSILDQIFERGNVETTPIVNEKAHETAYKLYHELGDYEQAFAHLAAFKRLDDEAKNLAADANNAILSAEFEFAQKELEIERLRTGQLESDAAMAGAARRQTQTIIVGLAVLGLGIIGFAVWRYWSVRKTQRVTQILNSELATKNTELTASNVELEKANQAKLEFLATTSHEVRTPLNAIISLTEIILKADEFTNNDRDYLEVVNSSGKNLLHILDDILDVSKLEAGRMKVKLRPLDIAECMLDVAGLWRNAAREKGLSYTIDVDDGLGEYMCDERLIRQIVSNLLSNSIKFTTEGDVGIELKAADEGFVITVRDTGIGIAADQQAMIFETFRQADSGDERTFGGTGLGLAICKKIVEALGGDVSVVSEPDNGAVFKIAIPAAPCKAADSGTALRRDLAENDSSPEAGVQNELSVVRVLVAEDNPANALVICAMLSGQVAQIEVVENGAEAVHAVQEGSFDVVLMDKQMPLMDGAAATREIRALPEPFCDIPVIGLTAHILSDSKEECLAAGMDDYLTKPVPSSKLKAAMIDAIKARRAAAA